MIIAISMKYTLAFADPYFASKDGEMIWDKGSGLVWLRCSVGQRWNGRTCSGAAQEFNFDDALALARKMRETNGLRENSTWTIPSIKDLTGLISCSNGSTYRQEKINGGKTTLWHTCPDDAVAPVIDPGAFPNIVSGWYWSSTEDQGNPARGWSLYTDNGMVMVNFKSFGRYAILLVRRGTLSETDAQNEFPVQIPDPKPLWDSLLKIRSLESAERDAAQQKRLVSEEKEERRRQAAAEAAERRREANERTVLISKGPQQLYLLAGQAQRGISAEIAGRYFSATTLYEKIVEFFPKSEYAVKATDQLTAMSRSEREQAANIRSAEAQREADRNASSRSQCFSQVRTCEASCRSSYSRASTVNYCIENCQRSCN